MNVSSSFSSEDGDHPSRRHRLWIIIVTTAKSFIQAPSSKRWSRRFSKHYPRSTKKAPSSTSASADDDKSKVTGATSSSDAISPTLPQRPAYSVATASQLNGRHVEHLLRSGNAGGGVKRLPPLPSRTQSLRDRQATVPDSPLLRSQSTPLLWSTPPPPPESDSPTSGTSPTYSPNLSTIAERTEPSPGRHQPDTHRPLSSILSIGTARIGYILPPTLLDYETSISRFGAKAIQLLTTLGPALEIYGRREMEFQRSAEFAKAKGRGSYFHPTLSKLFTRICVCDINLQGDPIHLSSAAFELGSAGLEIGACSYLNLSTADGYAGNKRAILRTEYDVVARQARYIVHLASPLVDEGVRTRYTLVSQVDVTNPLRRLALQETGDPAALRGEQGESVAVSSQMRRLLSFLYWLGAFHSNAVCFTRTPTFPTPTKGKGNEGRDGWEQEWQLRFASAHIYQDPDMVVYTGPGSANDEAEMRHMALMMDGQDPFVQGVVWGRGPSLSQSDAPTSPTKHAARAQHKEAKSSEDSGGKQTSYLQYFVPVTDGRSEGLAEKWWVSWLVEKSVPGFWGRSSGGGGGRDEVVEYPFLV